MSGADRLLEGYRTPPPPAPAKPSSLVDWLKILSPIVAVLALIGYRHFAAPGTPPAPPDRITAAAKAWRLAEGKAYLTVGAQLRAGSIAPTAAGASLKAALLPASAELVAALNAAMTAPDVTGPTAATAFETAGKTIK